MLAVGLHLRRCQTCRDMVAASEAAGGLWLATSIPSPISPFLLANTLARLETQPDASRDEAYAQGLATAPTTKLGRRWQFPNGVWAARVETPPTETWRAFLIGAPANTPLPEHRHRGLEYTSVLAGELEDDSVVYRTGDFADASVEGAHRVKVSPRGPGIVLLATETRLDWPGLMKPIGRLLGI